MMGTSWFRLIYKFHRIEYIKDIKLNKLKVYLSQNEGAKQNYKQFETQATI